MSDDALASAGNPGRSDASIFLERIVQLDGLDEELGALLFEEQAITRTHAERSANFVRHGDLSLAGDLGAFGHANLYSLLNMEVLTSEDMDLCSKGGNSVAAVGGLNRLKRSK